jgi:hypothetical protein
VRSLERRLENLERRLEDANPDLCEPRPCKGPITMSQRRLMPDGSVEDSGDPPPTLCDACPERDNPKAPIRHIVVKHGFPPGRDVWEVVDSESEANEGGAGEGSAGEGSAGEGSAVLRVVYDD